MLKWQLFFFFGKYLVLIGLKAEMFSSAARQVQAGWFHFSKQQELLLTQQQQVLQDGLAGHWPVTAAFSQMCLSCYSLHSTSPAPLLPYLFIQSLAILTVQMLVSLHPSGSWISKALNAHCCLQWMLNIKSKFKGSVYSGWQNPVNKNGNLKEGGESWNQSHTDADAPRCSTPALCVVCCATARYIWVQQLGIPTPDLALLQAFSNYTALPSRN